ncbi:hypothetical protein JCM10450v2_004210 [Rhodotorula kratochvilovae]
MDMQPQSHHYPPLPSVALHSSGLSASRWSTATATAASPPASPPPATARTGASTPQAQSLLDLLNMRERERRGTPSGSEGSGGEFRYEEAGREREGTEAPQGSAEGSTEEGKAPSTTSTRSVASSFSLSTSSTPAPPAPRPGVSEWAPPASRPSAPLASFSSRTSARRAPSPSSGAGAVTPTDSEPHRAPGAAGGASSARERLLEKVKALQARRGERGGGGALPAAQERDERVEDEPHTVRPATPVSCLAPSQEQDASPNAPSTSSLFSASPSSALASPSRTRSTGETDAVQLQADLLAARTRIEALERAAGVARGREAALEVREAALVEEVRNLHAEAAAREDNARAAREEGERVRAQLSACVAVLAAQDGLGEACDAQREVGRDALELAEEAVALAGETRRAADEARGRYAELEAQLSAEKDVEGKMRAALLAMRRKETDLEARVQAQEGELDALRSHSERLLTLIRRVNFYLSQVDGDLFVEPVGDGNDESVDPAGCLESALGRLLQADPSPPLQCAIASSSPAPTIDALTPASSSTSAIADELSSLCHANEELQAELADLRKTSERRIQLLVAKVDEIQRAKDAELEELTHAKDLELDDLRQRLAAAALRPTLPPANYTRYELLHLSQSPLARDAHLEDGSLPLEIDAHQPAGRLADPQGAVVRLVKLTAHHTLLKTRLAFLEGVYDGWKDEKRALEARIALLEHECAESVELVDELATELERRGREGVEEGAELAEGALAFFLPLST